LDVFGISWSIIINIVAIDHKFKGRVSLNFNLLSDQFVFGRINLSNYILFSFSSLSQFFKLRCQFFAVSTPRGIELNEHIGVLFDESSVVRVAKDNNFRVRDSQDQRQ
jgi:hypothetical protein